MDQRPKTGDHKGTPSKTKTFLENAADVFLREIGFIARINPVLNGVKGLLDGSIERNIVGINEGLKDSVRDSWYFLKYGASGADRHEASKDADAIDQWWKENITKNVGLGESEFRMGNGWKISASTKYNGQPIKEDMTISSLDAVFVKNKNGLVEVMDHKDPRYADMVLPYIAANIGSPFIGGKAVAALKSISALSKVATGLEKAAYVAGVGNMASAGIDIGSHINHQIALKPEAVSRIAHLFDNPQKMQSGALRDELNTIFEQYSYKNGPNLEQYYIRPLDKNENPLNRLQELSAASIKNVDLYQNPFDRSPRKLEHLDLEESRNQVKDNIFFQRGFLALSKKALSGEPISDQENMMLRFGVNVYFGTTYDLIDKQGKVFPAQETRELIKEGFSALGSPKEYIDSQLQGVEEKLSDMANKDAAAQESLKARAQVMALSM